MHRLLTVIVTFSQRLPTNLKSHANSYWLLTDLLRQWSAHPGAPGDAKGANGPPVTSNRRRGAWLLRFAELLPHGRRPAWLAISLILSTRWREACSTRIGRNCIICAGRARNGTPSMALFMPNS